MLQHVTPYYSLFFLSYRSEGNWQEIKWTAYHFCIYAYTELNLVKYKQLLDNLNC